MPTEFLKRPMRVLHLEDNHHDQEFVREILRTDGPAFEITAVKTREEFECVLQQVRFDVIISDYSLPSFDGLRALAAARRHSPQTPFIFFSGTIGEEVAVESLKQGATDYVLKERPHRLLGAVRNALRSAEDHRRRLRAEGELRQMEERLRLIARASNDMVWEWDMQTGRVWFSENFQDVLGCSREEIGARLENWHGLIHPDDRPRVVSGLAAVVAGGGHVWWSEHRLRCANGSYLHVYDRASVIYDGARKPLRVVGMTMDLTEHKQAEEKIREQAELLDKAQDAIMVLDANHCVTYWNKGAERIYGWTAAEVRGRSLRQVLFRSAAPPELEETLKSLKERGEWAGELREFTKDGRQIIVQARPTLLRDEQGRPKGTLIINTEVTERKQLEEQFLRAQRFESLGTLVGGIAHDLNNALAPVIIGVEILRDEALSPGAADIVATMEASARRSTEMVKQMLLFARGGETVRTMLQPARLLKEMNRIVTDTFPKSIQRRLVLPEDLWLVAGYPTQLHQVLLNLCVNARDAMPAGGTLTLAAENVELTPAEVARHPGARPGKYLCFTVADTGTGIPPEILDKIFQPFFTTKGAGQGTGLGLSTCVNIAKSHDGFLAVHSRVGAGTEFNFFLPAAPGHEPEPAVAAPRPLPAGRGERVLVVDDEESILAITRAALQNFGYEVVTAGGGAEAVSRFARDAEGIRLVISDLAMPHMDGETTVAALRKIRPDVKVLIASASGKEMEDSLKRIQPDTFITKPFTSERLLRTVHQALGN